MSFDTLANYIRAGDLASLGKSHESIHQTNEKGETLLHVAAFHGKTDIVRHLLQAGISIEARCNSAYTPLHEAARAGHGETLMFLLAEGANAEVKTKGGKDIYALAAECKKGGALVACLSDLKIWRKFGEDEIARYTLKGRMGYRLSEIFNFNARTYLLIARNSASGQESLTLKSFGEISEGNLVEQAEDAFVRHGGAFPEGYSPRRLKKAGIRGVGG